MGCTLGRAWVSTKKVAFHLLYLCKDFGNRVNARFSCLFPMSQIQCYAFLITLVKWLFASERLSSFMSIPGEFYRAKNQKLPSGICTLLHIYTHRTFFAGTHGNHIPYAPNYIPRFVYFLPTFWSSFMYCDLCMVIG